MRLHSAYALICVCGHESEVQHTAGVCPHCQRSYEIYWLAPIVPEPETKPWGNGIQSGS